jgi:hypothetical protein
VWRGHHDGVSDRPEPAGPGAPVPAVPTASAPADDPLTRGVVAGPSWHADPYGRFAQRWWDGSAWTGYAADGDRTDVVWDAPPVEDPERSRGRQGGIGIGLAGFAVGAVLSILIAHLLPDDATLSAELLLPSAGLWAGFVGACWLAHRRYGTGSFVEDFAFRFKPIDIVFGLVGSIAGRALTISASSRVPLPSTRLRDVHDAPSRLTTPGAWLALFLVICVGAPLFEELLFRGLLQPRLVSRFGPVVGVGIASVLFGAAHLLGWNGPFTFATAWAVGCGGVALGTLRYLSGRMGPSILAHAFFNLQVFVVLLLTR